MLTLINSCLSYLSFIYFKFYIILFAFIQLLSLYLIIFILFKSIFSHTIVLLIILFNLIYLQLCWSCLFILFNITLSPITHWSYLIIDNLSLFMQFFYLFDLIYIQLCTGLVYLFYLIYIQLYTSILYLFYLQLCMGLTVTSQCQDVIPLPRGGASSTYPDSQVLGFDMDEYFTCGCLLRMFECEWYVECMI